jgi:hypothetical protein
MKLQLEQLVKANGGKIYQTKTAAVDTLCVAERSELQSISHDGRMMFCSPLFCNEATLTVPAEILA